MRKIVAMLMAIFLLAGLVGCSSGGVSQADYDAVVKELNELKAQLELSPGNNSSPPSISLAPITTEPGAEPPLSPSPTPSKTVDELQNSIEIELLGMNLVEKDIYASRYSDIIGFEFMYTNNTDKEVRGFESVVTFNDIFGKEIMSIALDNTETILPRGSIYEFDMGLELNQFMDTHNKLKATDYEDIIFTYTIKTVLFTDGTKLPAE